MVFRGFAFGFNNVRTFTKYKNKSKKQTNKTRPQTVKPSPLLESDCFQISAPRVKALPPVYLCRSKVGPKLLYYLGQASYSKALLRNTVRDPHASYQSPTLWAVPVLSKGLFLPNSQASRTYHLIGSWVVERERARCLTHRWSESHYEKHLEFLNPTNTTSHGLPSALSCASI